MDDADYTLQKQHGLNRGPLKRTVVYNGPFFRSMLISGLTRVSELEGPCRPDTENRTPGCCMLHGIATLLLKPHGSEENLEAVCGVGAADEALSDLQRLNLARRHRTQAFFPGHNTSP